MTFKLSTNILSLKKRFDVKLVRFVCQSSVNCYQSQPNNLPNSRADRLGHPYDHLFEWKSLSEFTHHLLDNKVYFDGHLLAIHKPWGVGTYKAVVNITDKNSHLSTSLYSGSSKYCLHDSVEFMRQILNVKRLKIVKTLNRFMSGIVLLATDQNTEDKVVKAVRRAQAMDIPSMSFWCLTKGWPTIADNHLKERIGIKLLEVDELGDHKQPIIISAEKLTNTMRCRKTPQPDGMIVKPVLIDLKTIDINKTLGVSLVELSTNVLKWNLIECYLAYKTSFVLGDNRFCRQVKHVLGTPLSVKPDKLNFTQDVEPLPQNICKRLRVKGNSNIPVHIHHKRIVLPLYLSKKQKTDLVIESNEIPDYFAFSLKKLEILTNN